MIPVKYGWRSLATRRGATGLTIASVALAVLVFVLILALAKGIRSTFESGADARTVVVTRVGARSDVLSSITRAEADVLRALPGIAEEDGVPLVSGEVVSLVGLRRASGQRANVMVRGVEPAAFRMRPGLRIVEGRAGRPGTEEAVVSEGVRRRFPGLAVGERIGVGRQSWRLVGVFEAGTSPAASEVWADADDVRAKAQRHGSLSVVRLRANDAAGVQSIIDLVRQDRRLSSLRALREADYLAEQQATARPVEVLAYLIAGLLGVGATFGAMNVMYSHTLARTREAATMRVIGFPARSLFTEFLLESVAICGLGGVAGCLLAVALSEAFLRSATGMQNAATFAEVIFQFRVTPDVLARGVVLSIVIGVVAGVLPAWKVAFAALDRR